MERMLNLDGYAFLKQGRIPYARAELCGCGGMSVSGMLFFYDTPLGILVSAEIGGKDFSKGVYGFCMGERGTCDCGERNGICLHMPLIYGMEGRGKGTVVTGALRGVSLMGREISLRESRGRHFCMSEAIAVGRIIGG